MASAPAKTLTTSRSQPIMPRFRKVSRVSIAGAQQLCESPAPSLSPFRKGKQQPAG